MLATVLDYEGAIQYLKKVKWQVDLQSARERGLVLENSQRRDRQAAESAVFWFDKNTPTRMNLGIGFLDHLVSGNAFLDVEVGIAFAEELCGQLILNHYTHDITRFDSLTMPRSWIIRGFARSTSSVRNGSMPWMLITVLDRFISMLTLKEHTGSSAMDEICTLRRGPGSRNSVTFSKIINYSDEGEILPKLLLTQYPPAIVIQPRTVSVGVVQTGHGVLKPESSMQGVRGGPQLRMAESTPENEKSASILQTFFRRYGHRAGGPNAAAYEQLAWRLEKKQVDRNLRLCLRGPMPHVLGYLQTLKAASNEATDAWKREMQASSHETLDELHLKGIELREIRDATNLLIGALQPSSGFYLELPSDSSLSVLQIVEKVRQIPSLVTNIQKFVDCPADADYDLGVEPLLSNRVPWDPEPVA
ncbi:hypothetical protein FRC01_000339 [Tulasnella sp. 417]|nr:hypothetical protein FRC01_000339 [Tulasnella sp. 417]